MYLCSCNLLTRTEGNVHQYLYSKISMHVEWRTKGLTVQAQTYAEILVHHSLLQQMKRIADLEGNSTNQVLKKTLCCQWSAHFGFWLVDFVPEREQNSVAMILF